MVGVELVTSGAGGVDAVVGAVVDVGDVKVVVGCVSVGVVEPEVGEGDITVGEVNGSVVVGVTGAGVAGWQAVSRSTTTRVAANRVRLTCLNNNLAFLLRKVTLTP